MWQVWAGIEALRNHEKLQAGRGHEWSWLESKGMKGPLSGQDSHQRGPEPCHGGLAESGKVALSLAGESSMIAKQGIDQGTASETGTHCATRGGWAESASYRAQCQVWKSHGQSCESGSYQDDERGAQIRKQARSSVHTYLLVSCTA